MVASHAPPTGDLAHNPGLCPGWELSRQPFGWQAGTQSTDPHQPGPVASFSHELTQTFRECIHLLHVFSIMTFYLMSLHSEMYTLPFSHSANFDLTPILCKFPRVQGNKTRCSASGGGDRNVSRSFQAGLISAIAQGGTGYDGDTEGDDVPGGT